MPGVVIGHNERIAWGFTNLGPDVTDLYLEQVDGDERRGRRHGWEPLDHPQGDASRSPAATPVRSPSAPASTARCSPTAERRARVERRQRRRPVGDRRHPPTGGDRLATPYASRCAGPRWTRPHGRRVFALNRAGNWAEFRAAAALFEVPAQNIVYADVDGNIGYQAPGRIPVRGKGDGTLARRPAGTRRTTGSGFIPFAELPYVFNPAAGYIVTANQAVVDASSTRTCSPTTGRTATAASGSSS